MLFESVRNLRVWRARRSFAVLGVPHRRALVQFEKDTIFKTFRKRQAIRLFDTDHWRPFWIHSYGKRTDLKGLFFGDLRRLHAFGSGPEVLAIAARGSSHTSIRFTFVYCAFSLVWAFVPSKLQRTYLMAPQASWRTTSRHSSVRIFQAGLPALGLNSAFLFWRTTWIPQNSEELLPFTSSA